MIDTNQQIVIILHRPQEAVNIGAVIRAMKNMGFSQLRLVQPTDYAQEGLLRLAHRGEDVLERLTIYADLDAALADMTYVVGTAALAHATRPQTQDVRGLAADLVARCTQGKIALLFGQEDDGLDRHALDRCHLIASLPTAPDYPALNLAQSVLLMLYEVRMAMLNRLSTPVASDPQPTPIPLASHAEHEQLYQLCEEALSAIGFFKARSATPTMRSLRQIVQRAALRKAELALLLAIVRKAVRLK